MSWEGSVPALAPQEDAWVVNVFPSTKLEWIFSYLLDSILTLGRLPALALTCCAHPNLTNPLQSALEQEG